MNANTWQMALCVATLLLLLHYTFVLVGTSVTLQKLC